MFFISSISNIGLCLSFHCETQSNYVLKPRVAMCHYHGLLRVQVTHISTAKHACAPSGSLVAFQILSPKQLYVCEVVHRVGEIPILQQHSICCYKSSTLI